MRSGLSVRNALFATYVVACLCAVCWPGYPAFGNSIEPYVLGLPLSLAWTLGWVLLSFVVMLVYHVTGERRDGDA